jgi:hypothetical protein
MTHFGTGCKCKILFPFSKTFFGILRCLKPRQRWKWD